MSTDSNRTSTDLWAWLDGRICSADAAQVPVLDRGFLYGDSVYETLRTYRGEFFALSEHLDRLEASAAALQLELPWGRQGITQALEAIAAARPRGFEAGARITVTRGAGPLGMAPTPQHRPRLVGLGWPLAAGRHPLATEGVAITITGIRRNPPNVLNPKIKSGNFLNNILAYQEAAAQGSFEGVLLTVEGALAEATTSNLFWVRDGVLFTPVDEGILRGVTRQKVCQLARESRIPLQQVEAPAQALHEADEVFLTSSLKGVLPVIRVDGKAVGAGSIGPVTEKLMDRYDQLAGISSPE